MDLEINPRTARGFAAGGARLAIYNDVHFSVTGIVRELVRSMNCSPRDCELSFETWSIGGRSASDLLRWARRRAVGAIRLAIHPSAPPSILSRLEAAGVAVERRDTHAKSARVSARGGASRAVTLLTSANLEDMGCSTIETALALPDDAAIGRSIVRRLEPGGCFGRLVRELRPQECSIGSWNVGATELEKLYDRVPVRRLLYWREHAAMKARSRHRPLRIPGTVRHRGAPLHAKFALLEGPGPSRSLVLTSANLQKNRSAESAAVLEDARACRAFDLLFDETLADRSPLRRLADVDLLLERVARRERG